MPALNATTLKAINKPTSINARVLQLNQFGIKRSNLHEVLQDAERQGTKQLSLSTKAIVAHALQGDIEESTEVVAWASRRSAASRRMVMKSFIQQRQGKLAVNGISRLKKSEAADSMKDYFAEGGSMKDIGEWLAEAGQFLREHDNAATHDGRLGDA
ncbi:MAG: hypothetical protein VW274_03745, partial [Thalassolituus sp.]